MRAFLFLLLCLMVSPLKADRLSVSSEPVIPGWEGWGVSLCWWAGQCGKWDEEKLDEIIDWLVSPEGLGCNLFRYNIGGGEDPLNSHCTPHHMAQGKGLRAEMEGFTDFPGDRYHWERDSAQRRVMLRIREKRPDAVFEAFSNTPPYYMTASGCVAGNADGAKDNLRPECYEAFARYLVDVCRYYKDRFGIEFKTLEPFNESMTNYWYRNGSQEGCHFDVQSQIKFLRILSPILQQSGLSTVISASDETCLAHSIEALQAYRDAGVLDLVGQWNTHTYGGTDDERSRLSSLVGEAGKPLWMSETGSGGQGIEGNLRMAQRLFDDVRLLRPRAWFDWQYMEERSDQWCTIQGNFRDQTFRRVKNYYVRQQCTRFIRPGYDILRTDSPQLLAAASAARDTLVLVLLGGDSTSSHSIDLAFLTGMGRRYAVETYRTSETEDMLPVPTAARLHRHTLSVELPRQSITTVLIRRKNRSDSPRN